ncbi:HipA N-terminal domain-containing protein [Thiothrix lacustris]|uniref:HipA N-terminal domain-containing protein n=1 Tax=Thiothrix lacustris TaxID=525917 RepID=UPI0027E47A50|nr:HipA N-terminal domain-containing protein [Thiothrix lacustris]WMP19002.1 HipA N-terminal domain-containing protein [Thiothrix lacustris]
MTGYEHRLRIYLGEQPIGFLLADSQGQLTLEYAPAWQASGFAISPHLPLMPAANAGCIAVFAGYGATHAVCPVTPDLAR